MPLPVTCLSYPVRSPLSAYAMPIALGHLRYLPPKPLCHVRYRTSHSVCSERVLTQAMLLPGPGFVDRDVPSTGQLCMATCACRCTAVCIFVRRHASTNLQYKNIQLHAVQVLTWAVVLPADMEACCYEKRLRYYHSPSSYALAVQRTVLTKAMSYARARRYPVRT
eukprot:1916756-Rhodomonas_salina.2